jgi:hypothetical protein
MSKYLIGSKLLGLDNNKDNDYLIISDEYDYKRKYENGEDVLYRSTENMQKFMMFDVDMKTNAGLLLLNYQLDKNIIGQNFPIEYNLLDYRSQLIELLNMIVEYKLLNFSKRISSKGHCSKRLYHIAYNIFIIQNNSPIITEEQKAIIQKLHDRQMSITYIDELSEMIANLK